MRDSDGLANKFSSLTMLTSHPNTPKEGPVNGAKFKPTRNFNTDSDKKEFFHFLKSPAQSPYPFFPNGTEKRG